MSEPSSENNTLGDHPQVQTANHGEKGSPAGVKGAPKVEQQLVERADFDLGKALAEAHVEIDHQDEDGTYYIRSSPGDPTNPRYWPNWRRYLIVGFASWLNNLVCIAVSDYSTGQEQMIAEFGVSSEIGTLGLTLFILGFASGPMLLAPLSEFFGRRPVYIVSFGLSAIFQLPIALAPNIATVLVCRFLCGFFGSAPLANTGGVVHDLFGRDEGGLAVGIYALSSTDGPPFGNFVGGWIAGAKGWRWLFWFNLIVQGFFWLVIVFFMPETRSTILEMKKAKKLRQQTGQDNIYALHEKDRSSPGRLYKVTLIRPFKFLFTEPITYWSALVNGFTYGVIFLANQAFPLIFGGGNGGHGWSSLGLINSTYLSFVVGAMIGFALQPLQERYYRQALARNGGKSDPEARWYSSLYGIWWLPLGLFIAAWTSYPYLPFIAPLIGFTLFGIGFYMIIAAILNYVVDSYGHYSASSLAGVVFVRNIFGAIFPLFSAQMYDKLGNQKATTLIAGLAVGLVWIPFYFFWRGEKVRRASPYCAAHFDKES